VEKPASKTILLCSLGASWAVIPEVFGWLAPNLLDLYAHHPHADALAQTRDRHGLKAPDELWVCTTEGEQTRNSLVQLHAWWAQLGAPVPLRIWRAQGTDQLADETECLRMRELTLRLALAATECAGPDGQVVVSLAGGRKTMSADMQDAGQVFGAAAMLHVVGPEPMPVALTREATPPLFARPLAAQLAAAVRPLLVGAGARSEILNIEVDGRRVESRHFPMPMPAAGEETAWAATAGAPLLHEELARRRRESQKLWGNFLAGIEASDAHEPWPSLYRLDPRALAYLRTEALGPRHRAWLLGLPKADLHRHLGGCLDRAAQRRVAQAIWEATSGPERDGAMARVRALLDARGDWEWDWPERLKSATDVDGRVRAVASAALLLHAADTVLERNLHVATFPRVSLKDHPQGGFTRYERPGELTGSAQLAHPAALEPYAKALVEQARAERLAYMELRGSPQKYRPHAPVEFVVELEAALRRAGAATSAVATNQTAGQGGPRMGVLWIVDRRQRGNVGQVVRDAVAAHARLPDFVLGLDLAGDEGTHDPASLAGDFAPAFEACMRITIHAGEGEPAGNIWQAAYHLHADRIGHGLTLSEHPVLAKRFRDRGIALELCPTSNREVVGYADPAYPETAGQPAYPLRRFLEAGLPLTLCTDNPGISRTTLADEYLAAARMSAGGLTLWEALALMRQAFNHAFLPAAQREAVRRNAERCVFAAVPAHWGHR